MQDVILHGDSLQRLREIESESVQCIVTSPPYFGLRDYGTAAWVGGSAECDHDKAMRSWAMRDIGATTSVANDHRLNAATARRRCCPSCGATRQDAQIGLEPTPEAYVAALVEVFRECKRVLRRDGVLWLNLGDSYASDTKGSGGHNPKQDSNAGSCPATRRYPNAIGSKQLLGMPWRVAFALQAEGWILRSDCIWHKPNCMPESVRDRPTKSHEYLFLFAKSERYFYDAQAICEPASHAGEVRMTSPKGLSLGQAKGKGVKPSGNAVKPFVVIGSTRNKRTVWSIATQPYKSAHFATFPPALIEPCILAGSRAGDVVLDPFMGAGTVGLVASQHGRHYLGIELNASYIAMAEKRILEAPRRKKAKIVALPVGLAQPSLWQEVTA